MKVYAFLTFIAAALVLQVVEAAVLPNEQLKLAMAVRRAFENLQGSLPYGFKSPDTSVSDDFHLDYVNLNQNNSFFKTSGLITNLHIIGLNDVQVLAFNYDNTTLEVSVDALFPKIQFLGQYKLDAYLHNLPLKFSGEGLLNVKLEDLHIIEGFRLVPDFENDENTTLEDFTFELYLGDAIFNNVNNYWDNALNNFANKWSSEAVLTYVQQARTHTDNEIAKFVLPMVLTNVSDKLASKLSI